MTNLHNDLERLSRYVDRGLAEGTLRQIRRAPSGVYLIDWMPLLIVAVVFWAVFV